MDAILTINNVDNPSALASALPVSTTKLGEDRRTEESVHGWDGRAEENRPSTRRVITLRHKWATVMVF
ncbi:hypothetical protein OROGR_028340 [Orobanche gracilis]